MKKNLIKVINPRIRKYCICPSCGMKQRFHKKREHIKTVKDINLEREVLLKVRVVYAKCLNPSCFIKSFPIPIPGVNKHQRATERLKREAIAGVVDDNSTLPRISRRFERVFNTTGSKSSIDRWKQKEAQKYSFEEAKKSKKKLKSYREYLEF